VCEVRESDVKEKVALAAAGPRVRVTAFELCLVGSSPQCTRSPQRSHRAHGWHLALRKAGPGKGFGRVWVARRAGGRGTIAEEKSARFCARAVQDAALLLSRPCHFPPHLFLQRRVDLLFKGLMGGVGELWTKGNGN